MRWLHAITSIAVLAATGLTSAASPEEHFSGYLAKQLSTAPIKLSDKTYRALTSTPRNYSAAVLLTALDSRFGCKMCTEFEPEWLALCRSWTRADRKGSSRIIFGTLDFADGRDVFQSLGLQTAPVLFLFPPSIGPYATAAHEPQRYDFSSGPLTAEQAHSWIARHTPGRLHPAVKRPINWMLWAASITAFLGVITGAVTVAPYLGPILQNRNLWAYSSLIAILMFVSGHMFNQIRRVPYVAGNNKGGISYFADGFQNQYGLETQIIAAIYGALAFCTVYLALKIPRIAHPKSQKLAVLVCGGALFLIYSFLLKVFRVKNGGYPFSLPPFM